VLPIASAAAFITFLDVTVVNVALPDVGRALGHPDVADLSWTVTAYGAAFAALLTPAGRVADVLGHARVLGAGLVLFVLASGACAAAPSVALLIAARTVQGVAAALLTPASFGLLLDGVAEGRRARAVGIWGAAAATSALVGPSLGGMLVEVAGWRVLFAVNLPVGLALWIGVLRLAPAGGPRQGRLPDGLGTTLVAVAVVLLTVGMTKQAEWVALAGAGVLVLALARAGASRAPAVEIGLLRDRTFAVANAVSLLFALAVFAWLLAGPLFAAEVWRYDALTAALSVAPGAATACIASIAVGRLGPRGRRRAILGGTALFAATSAWLAVGLGDDPRFLTLWLPAGVLSGVAIGAVLASLSAAVAASVPVDRFAAGAGMNMTTRQLGGSLGVALLAGLIGAGGGTEAADFVAVWLAGSAASGAAALGGLMLLRA
jgi:EmrB/QacA subfamily drug resistance transporter